MTRLGELAAMLSEPPTLTWASTPGVNNPLHHGDYLHDDSVSPRQLGRGLIRDMTELRDYLLNRLSPCNQMVQGFLIGGCTAHDLAGHHQRRGFTQLREITVDAVVKVAHLIHAAHCPPLRQLVFTRTAAGE